MSDIDLAIRSSKRIETTLVRLFDAQGKGLHEKLTSVEKKLPVSLVKRIRYIATIRNKLIHEHEYRKMDDRASFKRAVRHVNKELKKLEGHSFPWLKLGLGVLLVVAIGIALVIYLQSNS
jgi:hypothetical protein